MSLEFTEKNLNEIYSITSGLSKSSEEFGFGFPFLSFKTIFYNYYIDKDLNELVNSTEEEQKKHSVKKGDVFLTRTSETLDELGMSCVALKDYPNATFNGFTKRLRPKKDKVIYPLYACYYFRSPLFRKYVDSMAIMTTRASLNNNILSKLPIIFPNYEYQKKIGHLLHNLDKKIELNKEINKNLFNIASSLQTDWMINFTPFKSKEFKSSFFGLIPEDWNVGKLGDVIELLDSKRIPISGQKRENMEKIYPYYGAASLMDYVDDYIFDGIYLLMGEDGTVIDEKGFPILQYVWGKFWANNHAHILKGKNGFNVDSLYLFLSKTNIQSIVTGAVQAKVNQSNLKSIEIIIPPVEVMNEFNELIKPFFDAIRSNHDEIEKLQKLRDTLLPKLMSGEIDVSKINCDL